VLAGRAGRLQTLNEYIQDTEDLVNLKLDQHRNQLIGIDLILTSFSAAVAMMTATAGYFGMNLNRWAPGGGAGGGVLQA
jgi:magnesium transporter